MGIRVRPDREGRSFTVEGQSYQVCSGAAGTQFASASTAAQYLTSPWTYHALPSGSQSYTALQYQELNTDGTENATAPGSAYGTTLPPLPSYLLSTTGTVATIVAPGGSGGSLFTFLEGGNYPSGWGAQMTSGAEVIGGSGTVGGTYYPEPELNENSGSSSPFEAGNSHWNNVMGYGRVQSAVTSSATVAATGFDPGYGVDQVTFAGGTTVHVDSVSGSTLTLASPVTEAAGTDFWLTSDSVNGATDELLGTATAAAGQGASSLSVSANTNSSPLPYVPYEQLQVGATLPDGTPFAETVTLSGSYAPGSTTLSFLQPLAQAVPAGAPVMYGQQAGDVTVEYLDIFNGPTSNNPIFDAAAGWTVAHNWVHDTYGPVAASGEGVAGSYMQHDTIEYNCFQRLGQYAVNPGGTGNVFDYNQVDSTPYKPDLSGNGQTGIAKFWASTNNDIVGNAFTSDAGSLWFDNGNTGQLVQGNYFYNSGGVENETGWNSEYIGNLFTDESSGIDLNDSGGWDIPGSRYDKEIVVKANIFDNVLTPLTIWGASGRSCLNSGEAIGNGESSDYCSGGSPQNPADATYFSHAQDSTTGSGLTVAENQTCSSSDPCGSASNPVLLSSAPAVGDWIGFAGQGPNTCTSSGCGSYANDPVATSSAQAVDVTTFTGGPNAGASPATSLPVASVAGFPSSGQVLVSTSAGSLYGATGAVLAYTGTSANPAELTGVSWVSGKGTTSGTVLAVQPYQVVANGPGNTVNCPGGNCNDNAQVQISPPITSGTLQAGTTVYSTGTCPYYATSTATPTSPMAPTMGDGTAYSYYDGCMWENRDISVTANTFVVDPASFDQSPYTAASYSDFVSGNGTFATQGSAFTSIPLVWPTPTAIPAGTPVTIYANGGSESQTVTLAQPAPAGSGSVAVDASAAFDIPDGAVVVLKNTTHWMWSCTTGPSGDCGRISTGYQAPASNGAPWATWTLANAAMSNSTFSAPLSDLNSATSPLVGGSSGVTPSNGDAPYNLAFSGNTYQGTWTFNAYAEAATCPISWSGSALEWGNAGANACDNLTLSQWQTYWGQDAGSTSN